jgi:hypothetical protein
MGENGELSCFRGAFDWRLVMRMRPDLTFGMWRPWDILCVYSLARFLSSRTYCTAQSRISFNTALGEGGPMKKPQPQDVMGDTRDFLGKDIKSTNIGHLRLETLGKSIPQVLYQYTRVHWTSFGLWNGDPSRVGSVTLWVMQPFFPDVSSIWLCHNIMVGSLTVPGLRTKSNSGIPGDRPWPSSFARNPLQILGYLPSPGPWTRPKKVWPFRLHFEFGTRISSSIYSLWLW